MLRKLGYAALGLFGLVVASQSAFEFSQYSKVNTVVLRQHDAVNRLGDAAPLHARIVVQLSKLPNELFSLLAPGRAQAQQVPGQTIDRGVFRNHQAIACTTPPTVTGATLTAGSCDYRGQITVPTAATVTITFGTAYQAAPVCTVVRSDGASTTGFSWTVSTTALTLATVTFGASTVMNWYCQGVML